MNLLRPALPILLMLVLSLELAAQQQATNQLPTLELINGSWFDGRDFRPWTMYSVNGLLHKKRPVQVDQVIDLKDGYVVPPFGEAHTHRPATPNRFPKASNAFLRDGVFYVMTHGNLARYQTEFIRLASDAQTIDGKFAGAIFASPQSHAVELWQRLIARGSFPDVEPNSLDGDAYFTVETEESLNRQWPKFLETKPDFVKIMVEYSEEYVTRNKDNKFFGQSGLHPKMVPAIVKLAHQAGLRVSAHIETAADFQLVLHAGVDIVAHLPGYDIPLNAADQKYLIKPADAELARKQNTTVIATTILGNDRADGDLSRLKKVQRIQKQNLAVLQRAKVSIAVGSDQFSKNSVDELLNLGSLGIFDNATLMDMACSVTPKMIFPNRNIGSLEDGCEASFLVLKGNPLKELKQVREIRFRCKRGLMLDESGQPMASTKQESATSVRGPAVPELVIKNCNVICVKDGEILANQMVVVRDGVISYAGPMIRFELPKSTRIIDGTDKYVMPGLVDMHVHIGHESELISYLLHGVTTVCNLGGDYIDLFSGEKIDICKLRSDVASGEVTGPRIFTAGQALDGDPRTGPYQRALSSPAAAAEAVVEQKKRGFDFIKVYDALDEPTLKAIIRTAAENELAVIGHIPEKPGVDATLASGIQLIAHAEEFYPAFEDIDPEDFEDAARKLAARVKQAGVSVTPNTAFVRRLIAQLEDLTAVLADKRVEDLAPRVRRWWTPEYNYYTRRDNPDQFLADTKRKYQWIIPFVRELHKAEVPLLTGTDSSIPGALPGYSMMEEFKDLKSAGLTPKEILQTATLNPARFLKKHVSDKIDIGEIRKGFQADLVLLQKNPLKNLGQLDTLIDGVIHNGRYATRDQLQKIRAEQKSKFNR